LQVAHFHEDSNYNYITSSGRAIGDRSTLGYTKEEDGDDAEETYTKET
jgi:hypothetical protein